MDKKEIKISLFCFIILFLVSWQLYEYQEIVLHLNTTGEQENTLVLPRKDKRRLEFFLRKMIVRDCGGYTLFGNKPMYMGCYIKPFSITSWEDFLASISPYNWRIYQGWKTWQKYQHLFPRSKFVVWEEKNPFWQEPNPCMSIILINKQNFHNIVNSHIEDFQSVLKRKDITPEILLNETKLKPFLKQVLQGHDGLIGTLFGYGRDNAWMFEERKQGKEVFLRPIWNTEIYDFFRNRSSFIWIYLGVCVDELSEILGYPVFMGDPDSEETQKLKKEYLETREKILSYYKNKKFLEATLSELLNED